MTETPIRIAITTIATRIDADRLANAILKRKLAACVNIIGPIHSIYHWQGAIERGDEFLLLIKTSANNLKPLEEAIHELHTYDTPEFIALNVSSASEAYAAWLLSSLAR
jgi:periplasmic divalent cation tolerance protein